MATSTRAGADAEAGRQAGPLDLHKGIGDPAAPAVPAVAVPEPLAALPDPLAGGCQRWPEHLRLLNLSTGELFPGRCRSTNLCRYCQTLYVVETVEMLTLDAMEYAPTLWLVLTAREHLTRAQCRDHLRQLRKALRRRWPDVEWFVQIEFQRRGALHLNLLLKGVPVAERAELHAAAVELWCSRVDALPAGQWSGVVEDGVGVVRYISKMLAHGLKAEQAPPIGWKGHRTSQTGGYLVRPASVMREEAKRSLRLKRLIHRGVDGELAELELEALRAQKWKLIQVLPLSRGPLDEDEEQAALRRDARARTFEFARRPAAAVPRVGRGAGTGVLSRSGPYVRTVARRRPIPDYNHPEVRAASARVHEAALRVVREAAQTSARGSSEGSSEGAAAPQGPGDGSGASELRRGPPLAHEGVDVPVRRSAAGPP